MRKLAALIVLATTAAWAGENFLGRIVSTDGGPVNNASTGYLSAGCAKGGACDQAFAMSPSTKITIQCDEAAIITVNKPGTDAGVGLALTAGQIFPSSTASGNVTVKPLPDGGTYSGGVVSVAPALGAAAAHCRVYDRQGTE